MKKDDKTPPTGRFEPVEADEIQDQDFQYVLKSCSALTSQFWKNSFAWRCRPRLDNSLVRWLSGGGASYIFAAASFLDGWLVARGASDGFPTTYISIGSVFAKPWGYRSRHLPQPLSA